MAMPGAYSRSGSDGTPTPGRTKDQDMTFTPGLGLRNLAGSPRGLNEKDNEN